MTSREYLKQAGALMVTELRKQYVRSGGDRSDDLYKSFSYKIKGFTIVVFANDYAIYVNDGRKPGKYAPVDAIRDWVDDKLGLYFSEGDQVAFLVNRKIFKEGIEARNFVEKTLKSVEDQVKDLIAQAIAQNLIDKLTK